MDEMTDYKQDEAVCQQTSDPMSDDERRRFMALDQAIRISNGPNPDASRIVKDAKVFNAYLRNGD